MRASARAHGPLWWLGVLLPAGHAPRDDNVLITFHFVLRDCAPAQAALLERPVGIAVGCGARGTPLLAHMRRHHPVQRFSALEACRVVWVGGVRRTSTRRWMVPRGWADFARKRGAHAA